MEVLTGTESCKLSSDLQCVTMVTHMHTLNTWFFFKRKTLTVHYSICNTYCSLLNTSKYLIDASGTHKEKFGNLYHIAIPKMFFLLKTTSWHIY